MVLDQLSSTDLLTDLWIGGKAVPASDGGRFDVLDPSTGNALTTVADGDPSTGVQDGPYVLVGAEEYSLHEADALVDALTQLVDRAGDVNSPAAP